MPAPITTFQVPGYAEGLQVGVPTTNDLGGKATAGTPNTSAATTAFPPAVWMVIFLVVGYVGLRWLIE
jgi:hypothetical protein